jgi:hypothetical protein
MTQPDTRRMIRRHAVAANIHAPIGNHNFRGTGIREYLSDGDAREPTHD